MSSAKKIIQDNSPPCRTQYAVYACDPAKTRGRMVRESTPSHRSEYQRDRDRIIHSGAFRKLEYKTQVFVNHEGDYYRTRLTHTLEVAQIARTISRALMIDEDLAEAVALAHDLGHTPFGHAGEEALDEVMQDFGGFNHNDQTLRVLTQLEQRYAKFDGLNLTWETLEGVVKHNGPLDKKNLHTTIAAYNKKNDLELNSYPGMEAQVAALADDIAYSNHDIDDGLRAGLFTIADIEDVSLVGRAIKSVRKKYPDLDQDRMMHEAIRDLIGLMVGDVLRETNARLRDIKPKGPNDIRRQKDCTVCFSTSMQRDVSDLKKFLMQHMYRHYKVNRMTSKARRVVRELFGMLMNEPSCLPTPWFTQVDGKSEKIKARIIADYIAGMTDRFALEEHRRLFDVYARS